MADGFVDCHLRFNLAYTYELAFYAIALNRDVGIDVEFIHQLSDEAGVAAQLFSATERAIWYSLPYSERTDTFFGCWTCKEVHAKATGHGLTKPICTYDVSLRVDEPARLLRDDWR